MLGVLALIMKSTSLNRKTAVGYAISAAAFIGALTLLLLGYEFVGSVTAGFAIALAYSTADSVGHLTHFHFGKKYQK